MVALWRKHRRLLIIGMLGLACLWACNMLILRRSFSIEIFDKQRIESAYQYWQENEVRDYRAVVDVSIPLAELGRYSLLVQDGQVISATSQALLYVYMQTATPDQEYDLWLREVAPEKGQEFTINELFVKGIATFQNVPAINFDCFKYDVEIDSEYHYPKSLIGYCGCLISDCGFSYEVIEFEPISF